MNFHGNLKNRLQRLLNDRNSLIEIVSKSSLQFVMCLRFVAILISSHPTITGLYKEEIPKFSYLKNKVQTKIVQ